MVYGDAPAAPLQAQSWPQPGFAEELTGGDTAGAAPHLEGRGSATRGFPSVLSKAQASLSESPRWGAQAGIPNSSKLPADFNWRFCPRQDCSARPVAF